MKKILCILFISVFAFNARADLPTILSDDDAEIYREMFRLQDAGKFDAAKKMDNKPSDKILIGEAQYQRYMAKNYHASLSELNLWLSKNSKHPGAESIYQLARKKGGNKLNTRPPALPTLLSARDGTAESEKITSGTYAKNINSKIASFKRALQRGKTLNAKNVLDDSAVKRALSSSDYGRLAGRLAFMYYTDAQFEMAERWGKISAESGSEYGLWTMGLISFKNERFSDAAEYFGRMLDLEHIGEPRKAEAGFWAGRSADANGDSSRARQFWKNASKNPQTFYGALSTKMLGHEPKFKFFEQNLSKRDVAEIMKHSYGMRGMALLQVEQIEAAERQFRYLATQDASDALLHAVHALAVAADLPRVSLQLGRIVRERGIMEIDSDMISSAAYPVPNWNPLKGWSVDRALVFAIIRQESAFKSNAKSHAGAFGVMQIMPKTAKVVARQNHINLNQLDLGTPNHNVYLGQTLIGNLLARTHIDNNLIKMLASYNAGEGRMLRWEKRFHTDDPLLYIESFPAKETREYIKIVMANLWLYRARLNQPNTTLSDLADGQWPLHSSLDDMTTINAKNKSDL
ncbi:MAG: lytic transglycosylase domain-containing protein [Rickettsiales bacterium]|jgi:soluble lytic murein transglycosylase-like protein|nr:lytic transglycosylase domain-containing protein [Rickettsiales bacterium]